MRATQVIAQLSIPCFCLSEALLELSDHVIKIVELKLLLVVVALYLLHQLLELYVFCILVDELLLRPLEFACQLELLLSGFNFFLSTSLIIFL